MKRIILTVLLAAGLVLSAAAGTPPHTAPNASLGTGTCVQSFDGAVDQGASPNYGESRWLSTGCGYYIRGRSLCASRFGGTQYVYGGWVTPNQKWSRATCTSSRPVIQQEATQIKKTANGSHTTCEEWPNFNC